MRCFLIQLNNISWLCFSEFAWPARIPESPSPRFRIISLEVILFYRLAHWSRLSDLLASSRSPAPWRREGNRAHAELQRNNRNKMMNSKFNKLAITLCIYSFITIRPQSILLSFRLHYIVQTKLHLKGFRT